MKNSIKFLVLFGLFITFLISFDAKEANASELSPLSIKEELTTQSSTKPDLRDTDGGGSLPSSVVVDFQINAGLVKIQETVVYLNNSKTQLLYNKSSQSSSTLVQIGKYIITLAPKGIGAVIGANMLVNDIKKSNFNNTLSSALNKGKGVAITTIVETSPNGIATRSSVKEWDLKLTSIVTSKSGYTSTVTYNYN